MSSTQQEPAVIMVFVEAGALAMAPGAGHLYQVLASRLHAINGHVSHCCVCYASGL